MPTRGPTIKPRIHAAMNVEMLLTRLSGDEFVEIRTSAEGQKSAWATPAIIL